MFSADTTGLHSFYTTFNNNEIMFHVSTILPFTANNHQQVSGSDQGFCCNTGDFPHPPIVVFSYKNKVSYKSKRILPNSRSLNYWCQSMVGLETKEVKGVMLSLPFFCSCYENATQEMTSSLLYFKSRVPCPSLLRQCVPSFNMCSSLSGCLIQTLRIQDIGKWSGSLLQVTLESLK